MRRPSVLPFQHRDLPEGVGAKLRSVREGRGWSRREVAAAAGIAARTLARIERGAQKPLWPTLAELCNVLDCCDLTLAPAWAEAAGDVPDNLQAAPGLIIRALREKLGMTLVQLSEQSGASAATLSRFERGLTASRVLARRVGGPELSFQDQGVEFDHDGVAAALGFTDAAHFRTALAAEVRAMAPTDELDADVEP